MLNLQDIFNSAKAVEVSTDLLFELKINFTVLNEQYQYFFTPEDIGIAQQVFNNFFNFFIQVKKSSRASDSVLSNKDLHYLAYKSAIIFGETEVVYLQKLIELQNSTPYEAIWGLVKSALDPLLIKPKTKDVDLTFWRSLIHGPHLKRAISLFPYASVIAEKFGPVSEGYTLTLTKFFPSFKNSREKILYLHKHRNPEFYGFAYKPLNSKELIKGTIKKNELSFSDKLALFFEKDDWKSGEHKPNDFDSSQQEELFSLVQHTSSKIIYPVRTLSNLEEFQAQIIYSNYSKAPQLAKLCTHYNIPNHVFNRCLTLLLKPKKHDLLPEVYINGNAHEYPGYHILKLPVDDYRIFLLGYIVNCCQSIGRAAEQVVLDGWNMNDRGFYVLLKEFKRSPNTTPLPEYLLNPKNAAIVGQGYAWLSAIGNLVIDSFDLLRPEEHDIGEKLIRELAHQIISKTTNNIFRVTIGCSGGKTPEALKNNRTEIEYTYKGLHHKDSKTQSLIQTRDLIEWKNLLELFLKPYDELSAIKKQELIVNAPKSIHYPALLSCIFSDSFLFNYINHHTLPLDSLLMLYIELSGNRIIFNNLLRKTLETLSPQHISTQRIHINVFFTLRLIISLGDHKLINTEDINSTLKFLNTLKLDELEHLLTSLKETKVTSFLAACFSNILLLNHILDLFSSQALQALIMEQRSGRNLLHHVLKKPDLLYKIITKLTDENLLTALTNRGRNDPPLLHFAVEVPESINIILNHLPMKKRLSYVQQAFGSERKTILHLTVDYPNSFEAVLASLKDKIDRFKAISKTDIHGKNALNYVLSCPPSLEKLGQFFLLKELNFSEKTVQFNPLYEGVDSHQQALAQQNKESTSTNYWHLPITSNKYILWSSTTKKLKDSQLKEKLLDLTNAISAENHELILHHFKGVSKVSCGKRNNFSRLILGKFSIDTTSSKFLLSKFRENQQLLKSLGIESTISNEEKNEQIRAAMKLSCK